MADSHLFGVLGDVVDPGLVADVIEVDVARLRDAFVQRHRSVSTLQVALEVSTIKACSAATMSGELFVDGTAFETSEGDDRLEGRAWRLLRLDGPVDQGMVGIVGDLSPVGGLDAD